MAIPRKTSGLFPLRSSCLENSFNMQLRLPQLYFKEIMSLLFDSCCEAFQPFRLGLERPNVRVLDALAYEYPPKTSNFGVSCATAREVVNNNNRPTILLIQRSPCRLLSGTAVVETHAMHGRNCVPKQIVLCFVSCVIFLSESHRAWVAASMVL